MLSIVHAAYPAQRHDVARIQSAVKAARQSGGGRGPGFAALGLLAGAMRRLAARFNAWSLRVARAHADAQFMETARHDPRILAELQAACVHQGGDEMYEALVGQAVSTSWPGPF